MKTALHDVSVRLGHGAESRVVLDRISLHFAAGEQVAIIGPSGAGKTTLLHTLACAFKPETGTTEVLGQSPWSLAKSALHTLRGQIFLAPQSPPLPPRQRVVNAVLAGKLPQMSLWAAVRSLYSPIDVDAAFAALSRFRVEDKLWLRCDRLSGGERQRVGLARMIVSSAPLLLLDEPVSALDPTLGLEALKTIQDEAQSRRATLVVSLHDVNLARARFSRLVGVKAGQVFFDLAANAVTEQRLAELYGQEFDLAVSGVVATPPSPSPGHEPLTFETPKIVRCN